MSAVDVILIVIIVVIALVVIASIIMMITWYMRRRRRDKKLRSVPASGVTTSNPAYHATLHGHPDDDDYDDRGTGYSRHLPT